MPTGADIITRAGVLLNDEDHVRWTAPEICDWINEGVRAIVLAKPSASSKTLLIKLVAGTLQSIDPNTPNPPDNAGIYEQGGYPLVLLSLVRNVTTVVPHPAYVYPVATAWGRMIKPVDRAVLEAQEPDWHSAPITQRKKEVRNYTFDGTVPTEFYVYPPNDGTGYVEAQIGVLPRPLKAVIPSPNPNNYTALSPEVYGDIGLPEPYSVPILDYVLYRCQMKDDIDGAAARSAVHYQQFATAIGMKLQVEQSHGPNTRR